MRTRFLGPNLHHHYAGMKVGQWYYRKYKDSTTGGLIYDEESWFQPTAIQKNGGYKGLMYNKDLARPRASIKVKQVSIGHSFTNEWTEIPEASLPAKLLETITRRSR